MSQLPNALKAAGVLTTDERIDAIMRGAVDAYPDPQNKGARIGHVRRALGGELTWHMMEKAAPGELSAVIMALLDKADRARAQRRQTEVRASEGREGHEIGETQKSAALSADPIPPARDGGGRSGQDPTSHETQKYPVRAAPSLKQMADRQAASMATRATVAVKLSRLDTFMVNGRKLGDCTVGQLRNWAEARSADARQASRDVRFALSLTANLPSGDTVREWWPNTEAVDALWIKAEEHTSES